MAVISYGMSDIGKKRKNNEDNFLIDHDLSLFMVADGMGGHAGGELASRIAVETVDDVLRTLRASPDQPPLPGGEELPAPARMLKYAIRKAGNMIFQKSLADPKLRGMGTTITSLWITDDHTYCAHVGDSRAYRVRGGSLQQVTEDHSWVREQVKAGLLTAEEAKAHSYKNIITRSVGFEEEVRVDAYVADIQPGDAYLLCSDGLSNHVKDEEILEALRSSPPKESCRRLIAIALDRGGDDNITAVIARIE